MKFALIGKKLSHSYSRIIHEYFFEFTGISGTYEIVEVSDSKLLKEKILEFKQDNYRGINITIPYKEDILKFSDYKSNEVNSLSAANTMLFKDNEIYTYNTDYFGFKRTLEMSGIDPKGEKWLVLGHGGGAKSVVAVLEDMGAKTVKMASRSISGEKFISYDEIGNLSGYEAVVNTTPLGMYPKVHGCPVKKEHLKSFSIAVDIVYNPLETKFLKIASETGLKTVQGLYMLVAQAVKAQEIWQNRLFDDELINKIYQKVGGAL